MTELDTTPIERLERVVIRFAGDSGDGMQLTGDRVHVRDSPLSATTSRRCRTSRPRSAHRKARCQGVSAFQLHFGDHTVLTPGDRADVLVAMNPAALKANVQQLRRGGDDHRQLRRLHRPQPQEGRVRPVSPLEDGSLSSYAVHASPLTTMTIKSVEHLASSDSAEGSTSARRTCSRSGCCPGSTAARPDSTIAYLESKFAKKPLIADGQRLGAEGRLELRRDHRRFRGPLRDRPGADAARSLPDRPRQHRARLGSDRGAGAGGPADSSSAPTRSPRRRTSCTSSPSTKSSASSPSRPRTRSPGLRRPSAHPSAVRSA